MSMNFNLIEQETIDYDAVKQDYINGLRSKELHRKYGIGGSQYQRLLNRFREDGVEIKGSWKKPVSEKAHYNPTYIHRNISRGICYWHVKRWIKGKVHYFGNYKTHALAEQRVAELESNNWEGLL